MMRVHSRYGLALVEVLLACLILGALALPLGELLRGTTRQTRNGIDDLRARLYLTEIIEGLACLDPLHLPETEIAIDGGASRFDLDGEAGGMPCLVTPLVSPFSGRWLRIRRLGDGDGSVVEIEAEVLVDPRGGPRRSYVLRTQVGRSW